VNCRFELDDFVVAMVRHTKLPDVSKSGFFGKIVDVGIIVIGATVSEVGRRWSGKTHRGGIMMLGGRITLTACGAEDHG
jgi:hypothetical protein